MTRRQRLERKTKEGKVVQGTQPVKPRRVKSHRPDRKTKGDEIEQGTQFVKVSRVATVTSKTGEVTTACSNEETEATPKMHDFPCVYDSGDFTVDALTKECRKTCLQ